MDRIDLSHISKTMSHEAPIVQKITIGGGQTYAQTEVSRCGQVGQSFFGDK